MASWYAQRVRRYEQMRFDQEPARRVLPFEWGLEHIGGNAGDPKPRKFLDAYVEDAVKNSDEWYAAPAASDYAVADGVLTFTSAINSPWSENNRVHAQIFPGLRRA